MPEHYKEVKFGNLSDYITPTKFRLIKEDMRSIPMGISEFAVEIRIKKEIKNKLSFQTPWDGILYGCGRDIRDLKKRLNLQSDIKIAYIVDWDDKSLVLLELANSVERPIMYIKNDEVVNLLENCLRPINSI